MDLLPSAPHDEAQCRYSCPSSAYPGLHALRLFVHKDLRSPRGITGESLQPPLAAAPPPRNSRRPSLRPGPRPTSHPWTPGRMDDPSPRRGNTPALPATPPQARFDPNTVAPTSPLPLHLTHATALIPPYSAHASGNLVRSTARSTAALSSPSSGTPPKASTTRHRPVPGLIGYVLRP